MIKIAILKFLKNRIAVAGLLLVTLITLLALAGPLFTGDPLAQDSKPFLSPSVEHPMGTDQLGRDTFSRALNGARYSLIIGFAAVAIAFLLGLLAGSVAGFYSGLVDILVMRVADIFLAFPFVLGAIAIMAVMGPGLYNVPLAIAAFSWASFARIYRGSVLEAKSRDYVLAARSIGAGSFRLMTRHIMPNAVTPLVVFAASSVAYAILGESVLSFVGLGVPVPHPSWGRMLAESLNYTANSPWLMLFPGLLIILTALGFILIGDGLRDALDPESYDA